MVSSSFTLPAPTGRPGAPELSPSCGVLTGTSTGGVVQVTSVAIGRADQLDPRLLEHRRELT
ncbi:MAG TPA: hypothetical protein VGD09_07300, partial [Blastococcus sp.]